MTGKHYKWQTRWKVDRAAMTAVHDTGLELRVVDGVMLTIDEEHVREKLAVKNGPHNAPRMVARLVREGSELLRGE